MDINLECPNCGYSIAVEEPVELGDEVECYECSFTSIVIQVSPPRLELEEIKCPSCGHALEIERNQRATIGDEIECDECACVSTVVSLSPLQVELQDVDTEDSADSLFNPASDIPETQPSSTSGRTERWEYHCRLLWATAEGAGERAYLAKTYPDWQAHKFSPEVMAPQLNKLGEKGWELIHFQPVEVGENRDNMSSSQNSMNNSWSSAYFCVFKRRKHQ